MPYVVRNTETGRYKPSGTYYGIWEEDISKARVFKNTGGAKLSVGRWTINPLRQALVDRLIAEGRSTRGVSYPRGYMALPDNLEIVEVRFIEYGGES